MKMRKKKGYMGVAATIDLDQEESDHEILGGQENITATCANEETVAALPTDVIYTKQPTQDTPSPPPPRPKQPVIEPWQDRKINGHSKVFPESTHSYLIYYQHDADANGLIVSIAVLIIQFVLYSVILSAGIEEVRKSLWLPIRMNSWYCFDKEFDLDNSPLHCEPAYQEFMDSFGKLMASFALSCVIFTIFIKYDFLACVKVWYVVDGRWAKWSAALLFIESIFAFIAGSTFISVGVLHASSYEAIMNTIGVLFVHELDEKMFQSTFVLTDELMEMIKNSILNSGRAVKCCGCCFFCNCCIGIPFCDKFAESWCILLVMLWMVVLGLVMFNVHRLGVIVDDDEWSSWEGG